MFISMSTLSTLINTQTIKGYSLNNDRTIQLTLADGTLVGSPTPVGPDGNFSIALDTAHHFTASGASTTFYIKETDASGQTAYSSAQQVTYDVTPPTVTIDSGGGSTTSGSVTLAGHLTAPYGAGRTTGAIEILDNHQLVGLGSFNSDGSWSATVLLRGAGAHQLTARATDGAGNVGESTAVTATFLPPLTSNSVLQALTNTQTLDGSGSVSGRTIQVTLADGTPVGSPALVRADGTFSVALDAAHRFAASGSHLALYVHETDASGSSGVGSVQQVTYDVTPPTVTIDSGGGPTTSGSVTLAGHLTAPYGAGSSAGMIEILDNHQRVGLGALHSDGSWSATVTLTGTGAHQLTARGADLIGNVGESAAVTATFLPPLTSNSVLRALTNTQTLDGSGSVSGRTVQLTLADGTPVGSSVLVHADGTFSVALDAAHRFAASGSHLALYVHETDASGRTGVGSVQQVIYDVTPPTVTIDSGGGETTGAVTLTGHLTAPYGAGTSTGTIEILDNHQRVGLGALHSDGSWSATVTLTGAGAHQLTARGVDLIGNVGESAAVTATVTQPSTPFETTHAEAFGSYVYDATSTAGSIYALYDGLLGRTADALGIEKWLADVGHGLTLHDIADQFLSSPEGQARAGALGNAAFVEQLYNATLHRHSDADGLGHWVAALNAGMSRADVGLGFSLSPEHLGSLAGAFGPGVFAPDFETSEVARLYYTVLGRAPDAAGLAHWAALVHGGTLLDTVTQSFLQAPEVQALTGHMSTAQFVDFVYENALGRHAEAGGLAAWVDRIDHGSQSRVDVATAIGQSAEAQNQLLPAIEAGWHLT